MRLPKTKLVKNQGKRPISFEADVIALAARLALKVSMGKSNYNIRGFY